MNRRSFLTTPHSNPAPHFLAWAGVHCVPTSTMDTAVIRRDSLHESLGEQKSCGEDAPRLRFKQRRGALKRFDGGVESRHAVVRHTAEVPACHIRIDGTGKECFVPGAGTLIRLSGTTGHGLRSSGVNRRIIAERLLKSYGRDVASRSCARPVEQNSGRWTSCIHRGAIDSVVGNARQPLPINFDGEAVSRTAPKCEVVRGYYRVAAICREGNGGKGTRFPKFRAYGGPAHCGRQAPIRGGAALTAEGPYFAGDRVRPVEQLSFLLIPRTAQNFNAQGVDRFHYRLPKNENPGCNRDFVSNAEFSKSLAPSSRFETCSNGVLLCALSQSERGLRRTV